MIGELFYLIFLFLVSFGAAFCFYYVAFRIFIYFLNKEDIEEKKDE